MSIYSRDHRGYNLFCRHNFPELILSYIDFQEKVLKKILNVCDGMLEVGCGKCEHFDLAMEGDVFYIGIDPISFYIEEGQKKIKETSLSDRAFAQVGWAHSLKDVISMFSNTFDVSIDNLVIFYPFNCIGNFDEIDSAIAALVDSGAPFLISGFDATDKATIIRKEYYTRCGLELEFDSNNELGAVFVDQDGHTVMGYKKRYLMQKLIDAGLEVDVREVSGIAYLIYSSSFKELICSDLS